MYSIYLNIDIVYTFLISCHFSRITEAFFLVKPFTTSNQVQSERPSVRLRTWRCEVSPVLADDFRPELLSLILTFSALKINGWKMNFLLGMAHLRARTVSFRECRTDDLCSLPSLRPFVSFQGIHFHQSLRGMVFEHIMGLNLLFDILQDMNI